MRILLYIFLAYIAYLFVFRFVIPVYRTTKQVRKGFREMQEKIQQQQAAQQQQANPQVKEPKKGEKGDYIEFEEV